MNDLYHSKRGDKMQYSFDDFLRRENRLAIYIGNNHDKIRFVKLCRKRSITLGTPNTFVRLFRLDFIRAPLNTKYTYQYHSDDGNWVRYGDAYGYNTIKMSDITNDSLNMQKLKIDKLIRF